jgi:hypothetical protein
MARSHQIFRAFLVSQDILKPLWEPLLFFKLLICLLGAVHSGNKLVGKMLTE